MDNERFKYLADLIAESSNQKAFDELLTTFFPRLISFANGFVKDRHVAEEIVEDVFVKLWESRKMLTTVNSISNYLHVATKHAAINYLNSKSFLINRKLTLFEELGETNSFSFRTSEDHVISKENLDIISEAINELPPKSRLIFRLIKEDGLKYHEVAQLLEISPKTVNTHMTRAMARITDTLKNLFPGILGNRAKTGE